MYADYILSPGAIFDGVSNNPFSGFVAVKGDEILCVSKDRSCMNAITDSNTEVLSYEAGLIVPGFGESHAHVFYGALELDSANLVEALGEEAAVRMIIAREEERGQSEQRQNEWIFAFGWNHLYWDDKVLPTRMSLDRAFPDRPVVAVNEELHALWVNSEALRRCGIDVNTQIPAGNGKIERDADGEPTGYLLETPAMKPVLDAAFAAMSEKRKEVLMELYFRTVASLGITSISNLQIHDILMADLFEDMESKGTLPLRMSLVPSVSTPIEELLAMKDAWRSDRLSFGGVKGFVDGTPMGYTGYLIDEYSDRTGFLGECYLNTETFGDTARLLEKNGIRLRLHACGDGAVREALNLIAYAGEGRKSLPLRHTIEHIEVIQPSDIGRFAELGAIASVQPDHMWSLRFEEHPFHQILGVERCKHTYPFASLLASGAVLAFGSDHPIAELNPMRGIYRAVTRLSEDREPKGGWCPWEKLSVAQALKAYTAGSAYQMHSEDITGTLAAGKKADIVVLDRNIFDIDPEDILNTKPLLTMCGGNIVFSA